MSHPIRIATFNWENFDDKPGRKPTLDERIALMHPQLLRINAGILCLHWERSLLLKSPFVLTEVKPDTSLTYT